MTLVYIIATYLATSFMGSALESEAYILHDIHMSRCDIEYKKDAGSLQISMRIFIDDLELDLESRGHDDLKLCTAYEKDGAEALVFAYVQEHLSIDIDGTPTALSWVGKEISEDLMAVWCYLEVKTMRPITRLQISNEILLSLYDDQQNVTRVTMADGDKSFFIFDKDKYSESIEIY